MNTIVPEPLLCAALDMGASQKGGVKITIFGPVFLGFGPEIDPGTPLDRPGAPPDINLHQKSAPETNSEAISRGIWGVWILGRGWGVLLGRAHMHRLSCKNGGLSSL